MGPVCIDAEPACPQDSGEPDSWGRAAPCAPGGGVLLLKLRSLRAVVAVIGHESVTQAAHSLHLSPSAVARAVSDIESELGFPLFQRSVRGLVPNPAGSLLGMRATRALAELADGHREAFAHAVRPGGAERNVERGAGRFAEVVTLPQLSSFVAVSELGSGALAAQRLQCSQPTIQRNLDQLENLSGMKLFRRTPQGTRLTDDGLALLGPVKRALWELAIADDELGRFGGRRHGSVVVAALPLSSSFLLPQAIDRLLCKHTDLMVTIVDGTYDALIRQLRHADIDMIVGALRVHDVPSDILQEALFDDTLTVVARPGHPCFKQCATTLADLMAYDWLTPLPGTPARTTFERIFVADGLAPPKTRLQVNSSAVVRGLLSGSNRLALLSPVQIFEELQSGELAVAPVPLRDATRAIGIATRRDGVLSPGALQLVEELRAVSAAMRGGA
ncbi:LysR family transcriptional regulator [Paraburkholderia sp. MM5482-R1]|uniref:LysR family transcriptional regulator n=1 Tax=unclassified Paraburkholderia TaxID=2615204 RepID=UPI003D2285D8